MKKTSFTLIEILVVVTIIALITSVAAVTYSQLGKQSRDAKRKADIEQIRAALEMYRSNNGYYRSTSWNGYCSSVGYLSDYISSMPDDPKTNYRYRCTLNTTDYTLGAFLETGGTGSCSTCGTGINCNYCVGPYGQE